MKKQIIIVTDPYEVVKAKICFELDSLLAFATLGAI